MHLVGKSLAFLAVLCLLACSAGKTRVSEVEFTDSLAYVDGNPYSGELWSDDTASYCLMAKDGNIVSLTMYHDNGQVALSMPSADSLLCFDAKGESIPFDSFVARYEALADQVPQLARRLPGWKNEEEQP